MRGIVQKKLLDNAIIHLIFDLQIVYIEAVKKSN